MKNNKKILAALFVVFLIPLIVLYARPIFSKTTEKNFQWEMTKGELEELEQLHLLGSVESTNGWKSIELTPLHDSGSTAVFESMYTQMNPFIESLQSRFPKFMRGKDAHIANFVETDQHLLHVADYHYFYGSNSGVPGNTTTLELSILDKETNEIMTDDIIVEGEEGLYYAYVTKMELSDSLLIFELRIGGDFNEEIFFYVYDLQKQEVQTIINPTISQEEIYYGSESDIFLINESTLVTNDVIYTYPDYETEEFEEIQTQRIIRAYDLNTGETKELTLPESFIHTNGILYAANDIIYLIRYEEGNLHIETFDVATEEVTETNIPVTTEIFDNEGQYLTATPYQDALFLTEQVLIDRDDQLGFVLLDVANLTARAEGFITTNQELRYYIDYLYFE